MICQEKCAATVFCDKFTYYTNTKGCWLQGDDNLTIHASAYAIRGPAKCKVLNITIPEVPTPPPVAVPNITVPPPITVTVPPAIKPLIGGWSSPENLSAEALALWNKVAAGNMTYASDELEADAKELGLASLGVPEAVSTQVVAGTNYKYLFPESNVTVFKSLTNELKLTGIDSKEVVLTDKQTSAGGGFPWWILLIALLALILCGGLAYYFMGGADKKDKKKKKKTVEAKANDEEAPLVVTPSQAAPAAASSREVMLPQMSGAAAFQGAAVASPVAYSVAPPVAASPVQYVAPAQYVYQTTSTSQMMPVAQPVQMTVQARQPADLFTQFDTDGDGRLSREELEAGMASLQQRPQ